MAECRYNISFRDIPDAGMTFIVDDAVLTPQLAHEINNFTSGKRERLNATNGDPIMAVIRSFAVCVFHYCWTEGIEYEDDEDFTDEVLSDIYEGWPPSQEALGIRILRVQIPAVDFDSIDAVKE